MKQTSKFLAIILVMSLILPVIVQAGPADKEKTELVKRIGGRGRGETSLEASKEIYKEKAETVVLAGYDGGVDALAGTLLASVKDGPLLLSPKDELVEPIEEELRRLEAKKIYILGGESVISSKLEDQLRERDYLVKRIAGKNREETAIKVAEEIGGKIDHVFLAKGYGQLADALAIGPVSARENIPVLLTDTYEVSEATLKAIKNLGVKEITILGGEKAISKRVEDSLGGYILNRIGGINREETALAIAEKFFTKPKSFILASGYNFTDALIAGYLGAKLKAPILLTNTGKICPNAETFIKNNCLEAFILGGLDVISDDVFKDIENIVKNSLKDKEENDKAESEETDKEDPKAEYVKPKPQPTPDPIPEPEDEEETQPEPETETGPEINPDPDPEPETGHEPTLPSPDAILKAEDLGLTVELRTDPETCIIKYSEDSKLPENFIIPEYLLVKGEKKRVVSIGTNSFSNKKKILSLEIPDSVGLVGDSAFLNCTNLNKVKLGKGLTQIKSFVFRDCTFLKSIEIPDTITSIGSSAFENCKSLNSIKIASNVEINSNACLGTNGDFIEAYVNNNKSGGTYLRIEDTWIKQ